MRIFIEQNNSIKRLFIPAGIIIAAAITGVLMLLAGNTALADDTLVKELVGKKAPTFIADTLDGSKVDLEDHLGKEVVILDFWSIYCLPCIAEVPMLIELQEQYRNKGLKIIGINIDDFSDPEDAIRDFIENRPWSSEPDGPEINYPMILDPGAKIRSMYKVNLVPTTVLITMDGEVIVHHIGFGPKDHESLAALIKKVIPGAAEKKKGPDLLPVGTIAPAISAALYGDDKNKFEFSSAKANKTTVLTFWSLFCANCLNEMPALDYLTDRFDKRKIELVAVNIDPINMRQAVQNYIKAKKYNLTFIFDNLENDKYEIADPYNVVDTPTLYVVDANGKIAFGARGHIDIEKLEGFLSDQLENSSGK